MKIPDGFKKLPKGKIIKSGDMIFTRQKKWREVRLTVGMNTRDSKYTYIRQQIKK